MRGFVVGVLVGLVLFAGGTLLLFCFGNGARGCHRSAYDDGA